ncbi:energy-coupling factor ABC transporter substrate-binding protein [Salinirarus marinus]|uniref:energy-coupling factor ABC transporter substrate-binding protein n=1 Tax=Salinirarus marinus TaxID=3068310 RepID=UPI003C6C75A8
MKRLLLFGVAVAAVVLLLATFGSGYTGTDQQAVSAVQERAPEYDPWASPAWAPGATTEAALFALQGGVGAAVLGYYLDRLRTSDAPDA